MLIGHDAGRGANRRDPENGDMLSIRAALFCVGACFCYGIGTYFVNYRFVEKEQAMSSTVLSKVLPKQWLVYQPLLNELVSRDIKLRYRRSVLGYLWSLLNPLLMMIIMTTVFSLILRFNVENYPLYVISGSTIFGFFNEACGASMNSILFNGALLKKVYVPKYIFPLSSVVSSFVTMLFSCVAIFIVMLFTHATFHWTLLLIPIPLLCIFLFSLGFGLLLSSTTVYFRDMQHLWGVITTGWMYLTPIFWPSNTVPADFQWLIQINPMYHFIEFFRSLLISGTVPPVMSFVTVFAWALFALALGVVVFRKLQRNFVLHI